MRKFAFIALLSFATPTFAEDLSKDTNLGAGADQIRAKLVEMGYDVRKSEMENGQLEFYIVKDGKRTEAYVNPETGQVVRLRTK